ncbi:MAG TPA: AAA family ATPase [Segatella copri]|nr:AAA family ATPase [Segatella copri]
MNDRKLPVGIQSFEKIRKGGYLYVDKTDIIWQLANRNKTYNYLSRPRRFGKSLLVDTLEAYFLGKKELFEGEATCHQARYESCWRRAGNFTLLSRHHFRQIREGI